MELWLNVAYWAIALITWLPIARALRRHAIESGKYVRGDDYFFIFVGFLVAVIWPFSITGAFITQYVKKGKS